jgi:hypothetical protein
LNEIVQEEEHRHHHLTGLLETLGAFCPKTNFEENLETLTLAEHAHGVDQTNNCRLQWEPVLGACLKIIFRVPTSVLDHVKIQML